MAERMSLERIVAGEPWPSTDVAELEQLARGYHLTVTKVKITLRCGLSFG
jgi:hypothetical protein